jgi:cation transport ATPase
MTPFEFVAAFFSVVLGLGVAHLLSGISNLIEARARVQTDWVHSLWVVIVMLLLVHGWWGLWSLQSAPSWSYPAFLCFVAYLAALYLLSTLALPRVEGAGVIDLKAHFGLIRPMFFGVVAAFAVLGLLLNYTLFHTPLFSVFITVPGMIVLGAVIGARTASRAYNASFALLSLVGLVALMISDTTVLTR